MSTINANTRGGLTVDRDSLHASDGYKRQVEALRQLQEKPMSTEELRKAVERVQLSRAKGWRMPPNTAKVDRTTRWGNPWAIGEWGPLGRKAPDAEGAVGLFEAMLRDPEMRQAAGYPDDLSPLRGKNLACWCTPGTYCHADVLLREANRITAHLGAEQ